MNMGMIPGPLGTLANVMQIAGKLRQDPSQIGRLLMDSGRINQDQYQAISQMQKPSEIGAYLMNNGIMQQQQLNEAQARFPSYKQALDQ